MNNRIRTILGLYVCIVSFLLIGAISARPGYWLKSGNNLIYTDGSVGITGTRISKIWAADLEVTNAIVGAVTGNAATVTNATLTTALTVNTGTVTLTGNAANTSALTLGAGASSLSGANTGDQTISDATISITDITTNNVSIAAHGFAPKGTNTGATFLRDDCTWATPAGTGDVSKVGTPVDNQVGVWTGNGTIEGTNNLTYNGANLLMTGEIGATGTRITKAWLTNLTVTNAIAGNITGEAATVTTIAGLAPNTATTAAAQPNITSLGTLTAIELGHATDTTIERAAVGVASVEGKNIYVVGGADVAVTDGGTAKSAWTQYLIPYADTTTSFSQIPIGTSGQVLTSNGAVGVASFQDVGGSEFAMSRKFYDTVGTNYFTAPAGVSMVYITAVGGGGGGGGGRNAVTTYRGGGGAGGGCCIKVLVNVTPESVYTITIGDGGAGGATGNPGANGSAGGNSTFVGDFLTATARGGGGGNGGGSSASGALKEGYSPAATTSINPAILEISNNGAAGTDTGGPGGGSIAGMGGAANTASTVGYGGGGGGGNSSAAGKDGRQGCLLVEW